MGQGMIGKRIDNFNKMLGVMVFSDNGVLQPLVSN